MPSEAGIARRRQTRLAHPGTTVVRIHHINAYLNGGAGVASRRLHQALLAEGIESRYWHGDPMAAAAGMEPEAAARLPWGPPACWHLPAALSFGRRWVHERVLRSFYRRGRPRRFGMYSSPVRPAATPLTGGLEACDLLHLHWVSRTIDYASFFASVPETVPVVWTLHDMQPLTGGCHQAFDCDRFRDACGDCPILGRPGPRDLSHRDHQVKHRAVAGRPMHLVTPSRWLESLARQSSIFDPAGTVQTIRNGISLADFSPLDKAEARRRLRLPEQGLIVAYGAESLQNEPKGIREFLEAISRLPSRCQVSGLLFGNDQPPAGVATVPLVNLGFLATAEAQRVAYSAADIFALPSHAETISQTAVEALACGTPVVAFAVGGVPEIVRHGETGLLARPRDVEDLAAQMLVLAEDVTYRRRLAAAGGRLVHEEFTVAVQVRRYRELYERVLAEHGRRSRPFGGRR